MNLILWSATAEKQLEKLPKKYIIQILAGLDRLASTWPRSRNVKELTNRPGYRLRVGDYRVLFVTDRDGELQIIKITQVRKRDDHTYRQ